MGAATMRDVARAAGVSLKTVSRVVNSERGVRLATQVQVRQAISTLDFHPNAAARTLRAGHALPLVGLVIGDLANPFYSGISRGVAEVAAAHDHLVIIGSSEEHRSREVDLLTTLQRQHIAGLLVVPAPDGRGLEGRLPIPLVCLDRPSPRDTSDVVIVDNRQGAARGVADLLARGHRRIGVVGDIQAIFTASERLLGYRAALAEAGVPCDESLLALGASDVARAEAAAGRLLEHPEPPSAIFAMNNRACVGALRAVTARHSSTVVLGFDDMELGGVVPSLYGCVVQDPLEMGRISAGLLFARLAGERGPWRRVVLPTKLVVYALP
jgi:LacI family transcriptional regulator